MKLLNIVFILFMIIYICGGCGIKLREDEILEMNFSPPPEVRESMFQDSDFGIPSVPEPGVVAEEQPEIP